jgi:hypothetical protein
VVACYGYYPEAANAPLAGRDVMLTLTDSGAVVLARQLGPSTEALGGQLAADSGAAFVVLVRTVRSRAGYETPWRGERVVVPRVLVSQVEERRFSRARTTVFGVALSVALVAMRQAFSGEGGGLGTASPSGTAGGK